MGASWNKDDYVTSSNSSYMTSLEPSDPDLRPLKPIKLDEKLLVPFAQEVRSIYQKACGTKRCSENQRSLIAEWRRFLHPKTNSQVHPSETDKENLLPEHVSITAESLPSHVPVKICRAEKQAEVEISPKNTSSLPMKCPPRRRVDGALQIAESLCHSSGSTEYLKKLYDLRTWNMYNLIMESRKRNPSTARANSSTRAGFEEHLHEMHGAIHDEMHSTDDPDLNDSDSDMSHIMVFPLDDH